jgi:hypothetical protein
MREFAQRTHQDGTPMLARDFKPASMDLAAMPVRVEQRRRQGGAYYRVVGITWGAHQRALTPGALQIRLGAADFVPVTVAPVAASDSTWSLWSHEWTPPRPGRYPIALRVTDRAIPTRRLDSGYYVRSVDIA